MKILCLSGEVIPGFMGINVGSDYDHLESFVLEIG